MKVKNKKCEWEKLKRALGEKFKGVDIELGRKLKAADEKEKIKVWPTESKKQPRWKRKSWSWS